VTKVSVVAKKICMQQNRSQKVFNKGGLYVCARGLDVENLIKTALIYIVPYFNFGVGALFGRAKLNKDLRGDDTGMQARYHPETF